MRNKILGSLMLMLILVSMYAITYRVEFKVPPVVFASSTYRESWVNVSVTNTHENMTTSGDIKMTVSSTEGVKIAWSTNITEYFKNIAYWNGTQGYKTYMEWLNGTGALPYHWEEMDWYVSEGSLTSITWDEIKYWWNMYSDTGGSVSYETFMDNTYMADCNLTDPTNDPDIIGEIPWNGNNITVKDLVVPANMTVHIVFKIVITEPGAYAFDLTSPNPLLEISPSSWGRGGIATILVGPEPGNYDYSTIQEGVNAASAGDTILVQDGTYPEALYINKSLTLKAASSPIIKGSQSVTTNYGGRDAVIFVEDATEVVVEGFNIEGEGLGTANPKSYGIIYEDSSGTVKNCNVSPNTIGDLQGVGIGAWDNSSLTVDTCTIENFGRIGVFFFSGCSGGVYDNTIVGQVYSGEGDVNYGIEVEAYDFACNVEIVGNEIYNCSNTFSPEPTWSSAGVVIDGWHAFYDLPSSIVIIEENNIHDNYYGIEIVSNSMSYAHYNNIHGNREYGVVNDPDYLGNNATFDARLNWWGNENGPGIETVAVDPPVMLTTDPHYDRNPSFFIANDGTWWLFFVRASDSLPHVPPTYNPDAASYDVWYMTSIDGGSTWSAEAKMTPTTSQRGMAAFQDDTGRIWVFVSSPGAGTIQYYTSTDGGGTWTGPTATAYSGSHVDAFQASDGKIWVFYEGGTGIEAIKSSNYGGSWTQVTGIGPSPNDGIPKVMEADGKLYVVWCNWAVGGKTWYTTSTDGLTGNSWNSPTQLVDVPGTIMCDPVLCKDSYGVFWLFYAPWDTGTDSQWIEYIKSIDGGGTWSTPTSVTAGGYGTTYWWDMWPEVVQVGYDGKIVLFYGSEGSADGTTRIDGNMWMMTVWTPRDCVSENVDFKPWLMQPYPPIVLVPELYVDPMLAQCWTGFNNTFEVRVMLANVKLLYGFDFKLTWDPTLLDLTVAGYSELWGAYPSTYPWKDTINNALGEYHLALSGTGDVIPFDGNATLATLTFSITSEPVYPINFTSDLALVDTLLTSTKNLTEPEPILHVVYNGTYMCNSTLPKIALGQSIYTIERTPYDPDTGGTKKFDVDIKVSDVVNLETFDFNLTYDPYLLKFGNAWQIHVACADGWVVWNDTQGSVFGHADGISPLVNGTVTIATVKFQVRRGFVWNTVNGSRSCPLAFSYTNLTRPGHVVIEHEAINGTYRYKPVPGDLDMSGAVNIIDLAAAAHAFGLSSGDPGWDEYWFANVYVDDTINILDIVIIARNFGRTEPEP